MTSDGRRDPRKPTVLKIRFKSATIAEFVEKHSRDVSRGGIFIKMRSPFPPGTLIKFDIQVAENTMIHGVGRVVWTRTQDSLDDPAGMGVKFIKVEDKSRPILEEILAEKINLNIDDHKDAARFDGPIPPVQAISKAPPPASSKSAKRTMLGIGVPPGEIKVPRPTKPRVVENADILETSTDTVSEPPTDYLSEKESSPLEPMTSDASSGDVPAGDAASSMQDDLLAGSAEDFVADISSAIDNALGSASTESLSSGAPTVSRAEAGDEDRETLTLQKGEKRESAPPDDDGPTRQVAVPSEAAVSRKGSPVFIWILLIAVILGAGAWYYLTRIRPNDGAALGQTEPIQIAPERETPPSPETTAVTDVQQPSPPENKPEPEPPPEPIILAEVNVSTDPPGASVSVNGKSQDGVTPLSLKDVEVDKEIELQVSLFGYSTQSQKLMPKIEPSHVKMALKRKSLKIDLLSEPKRSKITIDGKQYGFTPRTMVTRDLGPKLDIRIEAAGYDPLIKHVTLSHWREEDEAFTLTIDAPLVKAAAAPAASASTDEASSVQKPKPRKTRAEQPDEKETEEKVAPPVVKPETAPEPKPEATPEPKPAAVPEPKPEAALEPKPAEKTEPSKGAGIEENPF